MSQNSKIEWTETTWNPVLGCSKVSEGCRNCYAIRSVHRMAGNPNAKIRAANAGLTVIQNGAPNWTGKVRLIEERLDQPLHWRKPRRIFVNSLSDLFHDGLTDAEIDQVFAVMALSPQHTFQVLTKRAERMRVYLSSDATVGRLAQLIAAVAHGIDGVSVKWENYDDSLSGIRLPNVWLGVSVEDQKTADERIPLLLQTPAAVRWISAEPLLGPLDLTRFPLKTLDAGENPGIDWVVAGGESGPGARPTNPDWVRSIRDQCQAAGVAFFFKQWGEWADSWDGSATMSRVGKKRAGAMLDGREWREMPR